MQSYHRVHVQLKRTDRQRVREMLTKGRESARVLRRASILRQLGSREKAAQVAAHVGVAAKRDRVTINWQFTPKNARKKFGYNRNEIMRSKT
jgi:hypothetical protein